MAARLKFKLALACAPLLVAGASNADQLMALRALDERLITVGTRLAVSNVTLCEERQFQTGMTLHHLSQYGGSSRPAAATAFRLGDHPGILALANSHSSERAGLLRDDNIIAADGAPLAQPIGDSRATEAAMERITSAVEAAFADGVAMLEVTRPGRPITVRVEAELGCASRFQVLPSARLDARADGRYVQLTSAMIEFTQDDDELAATVAHELAHNILRHRARLNAAGVDRGLLAPFGRNGRLFRQTELEADRLAVHLMARAGFDPEAAVRLWDRQSRSDARLFAGTHPDWPARIQALQEELAAIAAARSRGEQAPAPLPRGSLGADRN